jgi:putative PIN family toxin of toxin-antitoxin system
VIRATFDTNVFVKYAINPKGPSGALLELWHEQRFDLVLSDEILEEIEQVLRRRKLRTLHHRSDQEIDTLMKDLKTAIHVVPAYDVDVPALARRDPDDLVLVATGKAGKVDYIVTRDEDLHSLAEVEGMKVVYPEEFLAIIRTTKTDDS